MREDRTERRNWGAVGREPFVRQPAMRAEHEAAQREFGGRAYRRDHVRSRRLRCAGRDRRCAGRAAARAGAWPNCAPGLCLAFLVLLVTRARSENYQSRRHDNLIRRARAKLALYAVAGMMAPMQGRVPRMTNRYRYAAAAWLLSLVGAPGAAWAQDKPLWELGHGRRKCCGRRIIAVPRTTLRMSRPSPTLYTVAGTCRWDREGVHGDLLKPSARKRAGASPPACRPRAAPTVRAPACPTLTRRWRSDRRSKFFCIAMPPAIANGRCVCRCGRSSPPTCDTRKVSVGYSRRTCT